MAPSRLSQGDWLICGSLQESRPSCHLLQAQKTASRSRPASSTKLMNLAGYSAGSTGEQLWRDTRRDPLASRSGGILGWIHWQGALAGYSAGSTGEQLWRDTLRPFGSRIFDCHFKEPYTYRPRKGIACGPLTGFTRKTILPRTSVYTP